MRSHGWAILGLVGVLLGSGCASGGASAPEAPRDPVEAGRPSPDSAQGRAVRSTPAVNVVRTTIGRSMEGRPIELAEVGEGDLVVLILATIHGNEAAGTPLVETLLEHITAGKVTLFGRKVLVVPVANPDGLAANSRTNSRSVDLNRNFPAGNFRSSTRFGAAPLSEPESQVLHRLIEARQPAWVVSLHQPVACLDWDGPGEDLARRMADACGLPAKRIGSRPGSLGSWVGVELGRPIITFELPRSADHLSERDLWKTYGPALLEAIRWAGPAGPSP